MIGQLSEQAPLRQRLLRRDTLVGTFCGLGSAAAAEVCAAAGADWLLVDLEHGLGGEAALAAAVPVAAGYGVPTLARVETVDRIRLGRVLDAGACGVMIPRVETREDVEAAIRHLRYPPDGIRGVATYNRAARFGLEPAALARAIDELSCVVQVETTSALDVLDEIAALDGADALFVGPADLSYALGHPMEFTHPAFLGALGRVVAAADRAGITAGIMAGTVAAARRYLDIGFNMISLGSDASCLAASFRAGFEDVRAET